MGSALAMARILSKLGKRAQVILPDSPGAMYESFYSPGEIIVYDPNKTDVAGFCALLVLDVSTWDRLGTLGQTMQNVAIPRACIDHHPETVSFSATEVRDPEASATAVLVYDLVKSLGVELTKSIAEAIYLGIMVDTQSFKLGNTNADAHEAAASCLMAGVEPATVYEPVFGTIPKRRYDLLAAALPTLTLHAQGKVATIHTRLSMYEACGASGEDDEGLVEYPRSIQGVEVAIFLRERDDRTVKVSWRSRHADVRESARRFGGGGHVRAAGATIEGKIDAVIDMVVQEVSSRLFGA